MNELEKAARSRELLENLIFKEAFKAVRDDIINGFETVALQDIDMQHDLTISLQTLKRLKSKLERWVQDGKLEQKRLDEQNWMEKQVQRFKRV